jgi:hypothetical protein
MVRCRRCKEFFVLFVCLVIIYIYYLNFGCNFQKNLIGLNGLSCCGLCVVATGYWVVLIMFGSTEHFLRLLVGAFYLLICIMCLFSLILLKYINIIIKIKSKNKKLL